MSRWTARELAELRRILEEKNGVLLKENLANLAEVFPDRSAAAIKKKYLELKNTQNNPEQEPKVNKWNAEEEKRLVRMYKQRLEPQSGARIKAIMQSLPGRTLKAIATKLREKYPNVYYMRDVSDEESSEEEEQPILNVPVPSPPPRTPPLPQTPEQSTVVISNESEDEPTSPERTVEMHREPYSEDQLEIKRKFDKILMATGKKKQKIKKFYLRPQNKATLDVINTILQHTIEDISNGHKGDSAKRYTIKKAIFVAGQLLHQEIFKSKNGKLKPLFVRTENKIKKLQKHKENAEKILRTRGQLGKKLLQEMKIIKKLKMTVKQYISSTTERITVFQQNLEKQKDRHNKQIIRDRFYQNPSIQVLQRSQNKEDALRIDTVETYYSDLYKKCTEAPPTPVFNKWISKLKRFSNTINTTDQIHEEQISCKILQTLSKTAPWKAPGEDQIPIYLYKIFPAAQQYLVSSIGAFVRGSKKISQADTTISLIFKKGDQKDPANYRPIAVLNTDYKILTSVIAQSIEERLPDWAIPTEQLARKNVWGTTHGFLLDKSITQLARLRRATSYSSWYDFSKAYDSVHHKELKRLIDCLPLERDIRALLKRAMAMWTVRVKVGKGLTKEFAIKRGVYQGDSISPLLFKLVTAGIIHNIKNNPAINKTAKGKQEIIAFMDDIKCHAPTKKAIDLISKELEQSALEIGLKLNLGKCGFYSREASNHEENDSAPFIPQVREGYKYLGLHQLERDTLENYESIQGKISEKLMEVVKSDLTTA
ncbi:uncharacterized protein LOC126735768 [Anthonomus grandis grandis]|uniref:uncharacterized protein LOC126735768 n=1 Tax=Anthonomus grandis grandis TaxID=2921223 RepID=UPI0021660489|nr:uncharacterized protein LOC126735768 [Anthonomus grandis grandis]